MSRTNSELINLVTRVIYSDAYCKLFKRLETFIEQHFCTVLVYISVQLDHATLCRLYEQVWSTVFLVVPITFFGMMRVCVYIYII